MRIKSNILNKLDKGGSYRINTQFALLFLLCLQFPRIGISQTSCLTLGISNLQCQPDATPNNPYDDTYTFTLEVNGGTTGWQAEWREEKVYGSYGSTITLGPFPIAEGPLFLLVSDSTNKTCAAAENIIPPTCNNCSTSTINICSGESVELSASARRLWGATSYSFFQWYQDGVAIAGATDSTYRTTTAGIYNLRASNALSSQNPTCYAEACCRFIVSNTGILAADDDMDNGCPGFSLKGNVSLNDIKTFSARYSIVSMPLSGNLFFEATGYFNFTPTDNSCFVEQFTYQVCNDECCDTAVVNLNYQDTDAPLLMNIPADETISCDEQIPQSPLIRAIDNCPAIAIDVTETSTQGEDGCSLYQYEFTRTWTASDDCGNSTSDKQVIEVVDITAPDIFKIYTLPNGKKIVAGVMENVNQNWKTISLPIDFPTKPLIFSQVVTDKESATVTSRIRNVSVAQFELKLQEEGGADGQHLREDVAWFAMEAGNQASDFPLEARIINLTDAWTTINFEENYASIPSLFASLQTFEDEDPASFRFRNPSLTSIELQIEEETSVDANITHATEEVAFLEIEHGILLRDENGQVFGETGRVSLNQNWQTITTKNQYYNPVIIAGVPQHLDDAPVVIRIGKVSATSFDLQIQEWNYLDGNHPNEFVSYMVIEGSIPLDASILCKEGTDSLEFGKDIIAIDNCDSNIDLQYDETVVITEAEKQYVRTWYAIDECGNHTGYSQVVPCGGVALQLKAMLQGAVIGSDNTQLMRDDLRKKGYLPTKEPYTVMTNFQHVGAGGGEDCARELLDIIGEEAIVDWVFIELRAAENSEKVIATRSGLLRKNGTVISAKGSDILYFENVPPGNYYVALRHRNHIGVETRYPYFFNAATIPYIDFTNRFLPVIGNHPLIAMDDGNAFWAGDLNGDAKTVYQGPSNDIFCILLEVLLDNNNSNYLPNYIHPGYTVNDFNLDGTTIYQGPNNDRANLLFNTTLNHPVNQENFANFIITTKESVTFSNLEDCLLHNNELPFCDYDNDGVLNNRDPDDDNDGVIDGQDVAPYNPQSDSDGDGITDFIEKNQQTNPLNACDPYEGATGCNSVDNDQDGFLKNYPKAHPLYDEYDNDPCLPNSNHSDCACPDIEEDGYIFVCHQHTNGNKQTLRILQSEWKIRQAIGDICGTCPN